MEGQGQTGVLVFLVPFEYICPKVPLVKRYIE